MANEICGKYSQIVENSEFSTDRLKDAIIRRWPNLSFFDVIVTQVTTEPSLYGYGRAISYLLTCDFVVRNK